MCLTFDLLTYKNFCYIQFMIVFPIMDLIQINLIFNVILLIKCYCLYLLLFIDSFNILEFDPHSPYLS